MKPARHRDEDLQRGSVRGDRDWLHELGAVAADGERLRAEAHGGDEDRWAVTQLPVAQ